MLTLTLMSLEAGCENQSEHSFLEGCGGNFPKIVNIKRKVCEFYNISGEEEYPGEMF
ncbi:hypothetical protein [Methanosarcina sp. KYL-1]|uniref:hypothetical protein n=1 Tax=Methanosarcina sp. KYL-1 TaxID=2602068 RepID=UPI002100CB64|nr:hypothetical protein [Methanosarcina sp. KYL-1]